jgi:hypothetical protein
VAAALAAHHDAIGDLVARLAARDRADVRRSAPRPLLDLAEPTVRRELEVMRASDAVDGPIELTARAGAVKATRP